MGQLLMTDAFADIRGDLNQLVDTDVPAIDTVVDGIDTLLTTIDGKVDTVDTVADSVLTLLTTVDGKVDDVQVGVNLAPLGTMVSKTVSPITQGAIGIFTVTGFVLAKIVARCTDDLTSLGVATIELGIAGNTAGTIAQTTATDLDTGEIWHDATPDSALESVVVMKQQLINEADVILTVGTADLTAGTIEFYCFYTPLSADGLVEASA